MTKPVQPEAHRAVIQLFHARWRALNGTPRAEALAGASLYFLACLVAYALLPRVAHLAIPLTSNDSAGYLHWAAHRDAGYPIIIMLTRGIGLGAGAVPILQIAAISGALGEFYLALLPVFRSKAIVAAIVASIALNPYIVPYHFMIGSESFFFTFEVLFVAAMARFSSSLDFRFLALASAWAAGAILVRAAGWSLLPMLPLALFLLLPSIMPIRARWIRCAAAMVLPFACLIAAATIFKHWYFGPDYRTAAARNLFAKTMEFSAGPSIYGRGTAEDLLWTTAETGGDAIRAFLAPQSWIARGIWNSRYQGFLISTYEDRRLLPIVFAASHTTRTGDAEKIVLRVARARIAAAPLAYIRASLGDCLQQWLPLGDSMDFGELNAVWKAEWPFPLAGAADAAIFQPSPPTRVSVAVSWTRFVTLGASGLLSLLSVSWFVWLRLRGLFLPLMGWASWSAVAVHGNYLLLGLVSQPQLRYSEALWPMLGLSLIALAAQLVEQRAAALTLVRHGL